MRSKAAGGLSARTVNYMRAVLRQALSDAERWSLVPRNVAKLAKPIPARAKKVQPLTSTQVRAFLQFVKDDRMGPLFHVAVATGLRQGELLGLRWSDIELFDTDDNGVAGAVTVQNSLQRREKKAVLVSPKTEKSNRTVPLPLSAAKMLRIQETRQSEAKLLAGSRWNNSLALVFTSTIGTPLNPSNVTHHLQDRLEASGLPRQRFHDLRHCAASLWLSEGVGMRTIMSLLGHSQIHLTMNTYAHMSPKLEGGAARAMNLILLDSD